MIFKETIQRDFWPSVFFPHSNLPGPLTNGLKYVRFWSDFAELFKLFGISLASQSPWGIILRGVHLPRVSYCAESISPGYHTALSQSSYGIIPRRVMWLLQILFKGTYQRDFRPPNSSDNLCLFFCLYPSSMTLLLTLHINSWEYIFFFHKFFDSC